MTEPMARITVQELLRLRVIETMGLPLLERLANLPSELHRDGRVIVLVCEVKAFIRAYLDESEG